jgi:prepilin-type N-terminal cleavage/methylation domain-containing protein
VRNSRSDQSGFTLLELMIVVAVVAILAAIAVPAFTGESRKAKGDSEVPAFLAELGIREGQYLLENGVYLATGASESSAFPATPTPAPQTLSALPASWTTLKVRPPEQTARCTYVVIAGTATTGAAGPIASGTFGYVAPAKNWFYILAHCDLDGNPAVDSYYFISSDSATIQKTNPGR